MDALDLTDLTAAELATRVHSGRSTAAEVARAHLDRIAECDDALGAFATVDPRRVLVEAAAVDSRPDRFALPLAGVPVAVADTIDVGGYPTRHGSSAPSTEPARRDDELVRRLRRAGAVIVGIAARPGGSNGGGAAAVAAGMAALAVGSGPIGIPVAPCGLVRLGPGSGPVARTAADAAVAFAVLAGRPPEPLEAEPGWPARVALSRRTPRGRRLSAFRAAALGAAARLRSGGPGAPAAAVVSAEPPSPRVLVRRRPARAGAVWRERLVAWLDAEHVDLVVGPAVAGPTTRAWTLAELPAVVVPVLVGGRPVGVSLAGRPGTELALLAVAARLEGRAVPAPRGLSAAAPAQPSSADRLLVGSR